MSMPNALDEIKRTVTALLEVIETVERIGDLNKVTKALESRVASLKKQEADIVSGYNAVRDKAEAEAQAARDAAHADIDVAWGAHRRDAQQSLDHAKAELETIATQRHRLETEIAALNDQATDLRMYKEQARQELAFYKDAEATAKADHERVKKQLAELKQAL